MIKAAFIPSRHLRQGSLPVNLPKPYEARLNSCPYTKPLPHSEEPPVP